MSELDFGYPVKKIDRTFLPNFDFGRCVLVVVIGQDGLVANTAKYVGDLPIVAVNPDPARNDGVLLPFTIRAAGSAVRRVLDRKAKTPRNHARRSEHQRRPADAGVQRFLRRLLQPRLRPIHDRSRLAESNRNRPAACSFPPAPARPAGSRRCST